MIVYNQLSNVYSYPVVLKNSRRHHLRFRPKLCVISISFFYPKLGVGYIFSNHISNILNWGQKIYIMTIFRLQGHIKLPDHADSYNMYFFTKIIKMTNLMIYLTILHLFFKQHNKHSLKSICSYLYF